MTKNELNNNDIKQTSNDIYKCPSCGANLKYNIEAQKMSCDFCGYQLQLNNETSTYEHEFDESAEINKWIGMVHKGNCSNCGAEVIFSSEELTAKCPFCNTSMAISTEEITGNKPDRVIPFKISNKEAIHFYQNWLKKKVFAPMNLKKELPKPNLFSSYIPSWTYDTMVFATYVGRLGEHYQVYVGSGKNGHYETRTRWFKIKGTYQLDVDDILVCSGKSISQKEVQSIEPFDTNNSLVYDNSYLIGHSSEHYQLSLNDGWTIAKRLIINRLRAGILSQYTYDVVDYLNIYPTYTNITYKYVLLPIWLCHYLFHNKQYRFIVNGETGKVSGKYPKSAIKIGILVLFVIAIIVALLLWYYYR